MRFETAIEHLVDNYRYAKSKVWIRDEVAWALYHTWKEADDRKDENCSEKPNNCEELNAYRECVKSRSFWDSKHCDGCYFDERCPFDEPKDEPKTQMKTQNSNLTFEKRTMLDCYNCKRFETEDECIECRYEPKDEPQRDCFLCKWLGDVDVCGRCRNRNLFAEADTEPKPKDEPQMGDAKPIPLSNRVTHIKDEPQIDCDHSCIQTEVGCEQTDCPWR